MQRSHCSDFCGDGRYPKDGGVALQCMWEMYSWKEIKNCPGRYVSSSKELRLKSPECVLAAMATAAATTITTTDSSVEAAAATTADESTLFGCPQVFDVQGKDMIIVNRFPDGGGLLTYVKLTAGGDIGTGTGSGTGTGIGAYEPTFVHTFNTESGLIRKIDAMGLQFDPFVSLSTAQPPQVSAIHRNSAVQFYIVKYILGFLTDTEKNQSAHFLVVRVKSLS